MSTGLIRPTQGRRIAGVAAALADRFGWPRSTVRALLVASILLPGPQVVGYLIGWILIPSEDTARTRPKAAWR